MSRLIVSILWVVLVVFIILVVPQYAGHSLIHRSSECFVWAGSDLYSPECVEGEFCEVRMQGVLRSPYRWPPC